MSLPNLASGPANLASGPGPANYGAAPVTAPVEKQRTNIYTMMLILSFIALVTGSVILHVEWNKFDTNPPWNTSAATPKPPGP